MQQKRLLLTSLFSALIIVGAYLRFPLPPVPITLQTLFVLLAGFLGGPAVGLGSTAIYLLLGAIGLPVFSSGGGLGILLGPTGGFLFGLLPASFLAGLAGNYRRKDEYPGRFRLVCILLGLGATLVIYLAGVPYLKVVGNLSWKVALQAGMLPFILGDLLKLAIATHLAGTLHTRIAQFLG
nr:biotin transporter BioY [uncultured Sphaerochaeta sp.]